jgi:hypothetical protein
MPDQEISIQELKILLKAINILMVNQGARAGQALDTVKDAALDDHRGYYDKVSRMRQAFIRQRGLRRYIYDMLSADAQQPMGKCRLLTMPDRAPLEVGDTWANRPLVDFLTECYTAETIPCFVIVLAKDRIIEKVL